MLAEGGGVAKRIAHRRDRVMGHDVLAVSPARPPPLPIPSQGYQHAGLYRGGARMMCGANVLELFRSQEETSEVLIEP